MAKVPAIVVDNDDDMTFKEGQQKIEALTGQLEKLLIRYDRQMFNTKAEIDLVIGNYQTYRRMVLDILSDLGVKIDLTGFSPDGKRVVLQHVFGAMQTPNVDILRQGVTHAIAKYNATEAKLTKLEAERDDAMAKSEMTANTLKTEKDRLIALQKEHVELKKAFDAQAVTLKAYNDAANRQLIIKNDGAYVLINTKTKGFMIGTAKPVSTVIPKGKTVAQVKVASLIKTNDPKKMLRFAEQEEAYAYLMYIKKNAKHLNESNGLKDKYMQNYVVGTIAITY